MPRTVLFCALALLAGCDIDGADLTYPGASVFEAPDEGFHLYYLAPPWRLAEEGGKHLAYLVVDIRNPDPGTPPSEAVSHKVWVSYRSEASTRAAVAILEQKLRQQGKTITQPVAPLTTRSGVQGHHMMATAQEGTETFHYRHVVLPDARSRLVWLSMMAAYSLESRDVNDMVLSFTEGPAPDIPTPKRRVLPDGGPGSDGP